MFESYNMKYFSVVQGEFGPLPESQMSFCSLFTHTHTYVYVTQTHTHTAAAEAFCVESSSAPMNLVLLHFLQIHTIVLKGVRQKRLYKIRYVFIS